MTVGAKVVLGKFMEFGWLVFFFFFIIFFFISSSNAESTVYKTCVSPPILFVNESWYLRINEMEILRTRICGESIVWNTDQRQVKI